MRLVKGAEVYSAQGEKLGTLERVVIDPGTKEVTHLVVGKGFLFKTNKVIAMDMVNPEVEDKITLLAPKHELDEFDDFEETHYVNTDQTENPNSDELPSSYWYPPVDLVWWRAGGTDNPIMYPVMPMYVPQAQQNIPEGTVALAEGSKVVSRDSKHVGNIEQIIVDPQDHRVTHFVIDEGILLKDRKLVPVIWISGIDEHEVRLSVPAAVLERLPGYQTAS